MCNKLPNKSLELKAVGWAYFRERERERKRERERVCVFEREIDSLPDDNQPKACISLQMTITTHTFIILWMLEM